MAVSRLWALNSSAEIPVKKTYGKFRQPARHMLFVFEALMQSMRRAERASRDFIYEGSRSFRKQNREHICPFANCTSGSSTECFISLFIRKASFYSYNDVRKSRFARPHLPIASKPQICKERFYSKVEILPEFFAIIYVANTLNTSL